MPTACITQPDCRVSLKSERIEVFGFNEQTQRDEVLSQIPLRDLERLVVAESVQVTSQALAALLRADRPTSRGAQTGGGRTDRHLHCHSQVFEILNPKSEFRNARQVV